MLAANPTLAVTDELIQAIPVDDDPGGKFPHGGMAGRCGHPWNDFWPCNDTGVNGNHTECEKRDWKNASRTNIDWASLRCATPSVAVPCDASTPLQVVSGGVVLVKRNDSVGLGCRRCGRRRPVRKPLWL